VRTPSGISLLPLSARYELPQLLEPPLSLPALALSGHSEHSEESLILLYPAGAPRIVGSAAPAVSIAVALRGHSEHCEESLRHYVGLRCSAVLAAARVFFLCRSPTWSFRSAARNPSFFLPAGFHHPKSSPDSNRKPSMARSIGNTGVKAPFLFIVGLKLSFRSAARNPSFVFLRTRVSAVASPFLFAAVYVVIPGK
jgi:hypothetical protein